jgi:DNA-binding transcriptional ArsR family regulator
LPKSALKILYFLDDQSHKDSDGNKTVQLSAYQIGNALGMQRRQATRSLRRLEDDGYITISLGKDSRGNLPNRYTLAPVDAKKRSKIQRFADAAGISTDDALREIVRLQGRADTAGIIANPRTEHLTALAEAGIIRVDGTTVTLTW